MSSYKDEKRKSLETQLKTVVKKLGMLQEARITAVDFGQKFKLRKDIERLEEERGQL